MGSLVMNENQPSTVPVVIGVGSNCTGTVVRSLGLMSLAWRNAFHAEVLVDCTPIFLPIMSDGVGIALSASDMMANGFFWYWAPTMIRSAPAKIAEPVMSGAGVHTKAAPDATTASWVTLAPPELRLTSEKPAAV